MSAFLGKIHYWLYNKIELHEKLIEEVLKGTKEKNYPINELREKSYELYGKAPEGKLEDIIEHENIHGWLQRRIESVEYRLAYIVSTLLKENILSIDELKRIFNKNGIEVMSSIDKINFTLEQLYNLIFDYMLEGMPCDRVNKVISSTEDKILWEKTCCIHEKYWNENGGDVTNFYKLREAWINGFLMASGMDVEYGMTSDKKSYIKRRQ